MGQLTNQYVSSSYQGLLKMTDSTQGLTNTLQTIQTGDGDNSPLQMSLTEVNISGSFLINNVPITNGTNGTSGTSGVAGSSGTSGSSGSNGSSGTSGSNGSSGTSGSNGSSGTSGSNGSSGTSGIGVSGSSGTSGSSGVSGSSGTSGVNGTSGSSGTSGIGVNGTSGSSGTSGVSGSSGTSGVGTSGTSGTSGVSGSSGTSGSNGSDGSSGTSGVAGSSGTSGSNGSDGSSGTSGSSGSAGTSGTSGTSGQNGISAGRTYYFNQSETSDVSGYKVLSEEPTTGTTQTVTKTLTNTQQNVLVESYITNELGFSLIPSGVQRFHFHLLKPAENDDVDVYVTLQLANSTGGTIGSLITSASQYIGWNSGDPAEVEVDIVFSHTAIDPTNRFIVKIYLNNNDSTTHNVNYYTEGTEYSYVITSVGVVAGSSGTSGTSGVAGTSGTSGTSFESPYTGDIVVTGSIDITGQFLVNGVPITGSGGGGDRNGLITTGSIGEEQVITGSLTVNSFLSRQDKGLVMLQSKAQKDSIVFGDGLFITASTPVSQSNLIFGGNVQGTTLAPAFTGSIVISGSNNIMLQGARPDSIAQGTYGYVNGGGNIIGNIPQLATSSIYRPSFNNNQINSALFLNYTSGALVAPAFSSNLIFGGLTFQHQSGSGNYTQNLNVGTLNSNANITRLNINNVVNNNVIAGLTTTLNHNSSSINYQQNIGGGMTVTNNYSSSVSTTVDNITVSANIFQGSGNSINVTGSNSSSRRQFNSNAVVGINNRINSDYINSTGGHLTATSLLGQELIVSASAQSATNGGTVIVGRYNATGSLQESSNDSVFVVGNGGGSSTRRNAIRVDNQGNTTVTGSLIVSGSIYNRGASNGINSLAYGEQALFKAQTGTTNNTALGYQALYNLTTGGSNTAIGANALLNNISGSNNIAIGDNSLRDNIAGGNTGIGSFTLFRNTIGSNNLAFGNSALNENVSGSNNVAIGGSALQNSASSFNVAIGATAMNQNRTGENNIAIGQSALQANTTGNKNTVVGWNGMVNNVTGATNTVIGTQGLQENVNGSGNVAIGYSAGYYSTGSNGFYIGNDNYGSLSNEQNKSLMYGQFDGTTANQTLQINAATTVTNNLVVSGSIASTKSFAQVTLASNQTVTAGSDATVNFDTVDFDPNSWWNSGSKIFQPTIPGYYEFTTEILVATGTTNGQMNVQLNKNSGTQAFIYQAEVNKNINQTLGFSKILYMNGSSDNVKITFYTSSGSGSQDIQGGTGTLFNVKLL